MLFDGKWNRQSMMAGKSGLEKQTRFCMHFHLKRRKEEKKDKSPYDAGNINIFGKKILY